MFIGKQMKNFQGFNKILFLKYNKHISSVKLYFKEREKNNLIITLENSYLFSTV